MYAGRAMSRLSTLFLPTLRDDPADAEAISHRLMVRAGLIRQLGAGLWTWMPAGMRSIRKIETIIRDEMDAIGAQEMLMPVLQPAENWQKTGRYEIDELFKLDDLVAAGLLPVLGGLKHGISISWAPIASISSRMIASIFRIERIPAGIQVQSPAPSWRISPARTIRRCEIASASAGSSRRSAGTALTGGSSRGQRTSGGPSRRSTIGARGEAIGVTRTNKQIVGSGVFVALLALVVGLVVSVPRSSGAPVEARNGHYVGVGDGQLRVSFLVRQRVAQSFFGSSSSRSTIHPLLDGRHHPGPRPSRQQGSLPDRRRQGTSDESDKGRFAAPKLVKGGIDYTQTNPALCPGDYALAYEARRFGPPGPAKSARSAGQGQVSPRNGEYAGGSVNAAVWFDVVGGQVQSGRVRGLFPTCDESFPVVNTSDQPDGKGRFKIERTSGGDTVKIRGRFTRDTLVSGRVVWDQDDNCPAGQRKFSYTAQRFGPVA